MKAGNDCLNRQAFGFGDGVDLPEAFAGGIEGIDGISLAGQKEAVAALPGADIEDASGRVDFGIVVAQDFGRLVAEIGGFIFICVVVGLYLFPAFLRYSRKACM